METNLESTSIRLEKNKRYGTLDYHYYLIKALDLKKGMNVLDIGCGNGIHLFRISDIIQPSGKAIGTDISKECIETINKKTNIQARRLSHTELDKLKLKFDRVLSSYSIYYSKDIKKTIKDIYNLLKEKGVFLVSGSDKGNNKEILDLLYSLNIEVNFEYSNWFSRFICLKPFLDNFFEVTEYHLENVITFPNKEELLNYLKHTKLCKNHIDKITPFINFRKITKKILLYRCVKKSN